MTILASIVFGYLIGSLPTANTLARLRGIDLRSGGSGNPGTNNARRLGGNGLAATILVIELAKGVTGAGVGLLLGDDVSGVAAGIAAIVGNLYNIWYRFQGGKGLAIGGGVLLILWPLAFPVAVLLIASLAAATRSSGKASIAALVGLVVMGVLWWTLGFPNGWGITDLALLPLLGASMALLIMPKHVADARNGVRKPSPAVR